MMSQTAVVVDTELTSYKDRFSLFSRLLLQVSAVAGHYGLLCVHKMRFDMHKECTIELPLYC